MGWGADQGYDELQKQSFREWKDSLTWKEYASWQWRRWRSFFAGMATALILISMLLYLL